MNIQSNYSYNYNVSMQGKAPKNGRWNRFTSKVKQHILNAFPQKDIKSDKTTLDKKKKIDERISRPAENRLIMGATALLTQPAIDYYNHRVDDETRTVSRNRTIAKILAGTAVGIAVRGSCYKLIEKMTDFSGVKKYSKSLIPKRYFYTFKNSAKQLANYRNALSSAVAILVMCFTNFWFDAPLTALLTNRFNAKSKQNHQRKEGLNV